MNNDTSSISNAIFIMDNITQELKIINDIVNSTKSCVKITNLKDDKNILLEILSDLELGIFFLLHNNYLDRKLLENLYNLSFEQ